VGSNPTLSAERNKMSDINHKSSTVWLDDVDKNTTNVIGLDLVGNILVLSICKYTETATGRSYDSVAEFAVDFNTFNKTIEYLDLIQE